MVLIFGPGTGDGGPGVLNRGRGQGSGCKVFSTHPNGKAPFGLLELTGVNFKVLNHFLNQIPLINY